MTLPRSLWAPAGRIRVTVSRTPIANKQGEPLNGCYEPDRRRITIAPGLTPALAHEILEHEWTHAIVYDCGGDSVLTAKQNEWVAEVMGKALGVRFHRRRP